MCLSYDKEELDEELDEATEVAVAPVPAQTRVSAPLPVGTYLSPVWHAPSLYRKLPAAERLVRINTDFIQGGTNQHPIVVIDADGRETFCMDVHFVGPVEFVVAIQDTALRYDRTVRLKTSDALWIAE